MDTNMVPFRFIPEWTFAERLRKVRRETGLGQIEFAERDAGGDAVGRVSGTLRPMRCAVAALAVLLALAGCTATPEPTVAPGEGPAASEAPYSGPVEGEPTTAPEQKAASFHEKYTYPDGLEVEVIKLRAGKLTAKDIEDYDEYKVGTPYVVFTVRVRNGSKATVDLVGSATVTYGPDGTEAAGLFMLDDVDSMDGKVIPGKARTGGFGYVIPEKYQDDVVLEFQADFEHDSAVFAGSVL